MAVPYLTSSTAARVYFYLVDATDGITAETGEAGGQPQVSKNNGAFGTTGIGTLTHLGNGHYHATLDLTAQSAAGGDKFVGRYKSANTAEAPSLNEIHAVTYDPSTFGADIEGTGFVSAQHSLVALKNYLISVVAPIIVPASTASSLLAGSWLSRVIAGIRKSTDEPSVNAKYTDNDLIAKLKEAWSEIWIDLNNNTENPVVVRMDVVITANQQYYQLPPTVGQLLRLAKINSETDLVDWEVDTLGHYNPLGYGFKIEGNTLRLGAKWKEGETLRLEYIPGGEINPITGTLTGALTLSANTITLPSAPTSGTLETRDNGYAGYMVRTFPAAGTVPVSGEGETIIQERLVTAYNSQTRVATLATNFNPAISLGEGETLSVEVYPADGALLEAIISLRVAQNILSTEGLMERYQMQLKEYQRKIRALRLMMNTMNSRRANHFHGDEPENRRFGTGVYY